MRMLSRAALSLSGLVLCGGLTCFSAPAVAAEDNGFVTLEVENDLFAKFANTDRHYTNGIKASWLSAPQDDLPNWLQTLSAPPIFGLFTNDAHIVSTTHRVGVALSQAMFTPDDTDTSALITTDRPYAAWLHTTLSLESVRTNDAGEAWQDQWRLDLGIVGPWALGRQVQNTWHKLINAEQSNGWANQIRNEPGINLSFERAWRSKSFATPRLFGMETDAIPYAVVALGNVQTYAGLGGTLRIGPDLPNDFGPPRIQPATGGSEWFHSAGGFDWYLFAGLEGRSVARDIFLDGNTFRDSASVDKRIFVGDATLGAVAVLGRARLSFTHDFRSKEFYGQPKIDQFGSIALSFAL